MIQVIVGRSGYGPYGGPLSHCFRWEQYQGGNWTKFGDLAAAVVVGPEDAYFPPYGDSAMNALYPVHSHNLQYQSNDGRLVSLTAPGFLAVW